MKRCMENGIPGPVVKRSACYNRAEMAMSEPATALPSSVSSGGGDGGGSAAPRLTADDALEYLKAVKDMFKDDKEKFDEFLKVMQDFKTQRINAIAVLITRMKELFRGHRALILGFNAFLPKGYEIILQEEEEHITKKQPVEFDQAIDYVNKIRTRFQNDEHVYKAFLEILNMYRNGNKSIKEVHQEVAQLFTQHADLVEEFTYFASDSTGPVSSITPIRPGAANRASRSKEKTPGIAQVQGQPQGAAPKVAKRKQLSSDADQPERASESVDDGRSLKRMCPSKLEKVQRKRIEKEKQEEEVSERTERGDKSSANDAADEGKDDIDGSQRLPHKSKSARRDDDLIRKQSEAVEDGEVLQGQLFTFPKSSSLNNEQQVFFDKVKGRLRHHGLYQEFLKCLNIFNQEIISLSELQSLVVDFFGKHPDLIEGFIDVIEVRCTPSYRLDPTTNAKPSSTHRTELARTVLNDSWVSVPSGSEDFSFKHMPKNEYESVFRCEDDRFELDILVEWAAVTARRVNELLEYIQHPSFNQQLSTFVLDDHLSAINLRCRERIYGDHGLDVIDLLRENAPTALPVVLTCLRQKKDEWSRFRIEMNKVWKEVYSKNHRCFYFKQQDKKSMRKTTGMAEINEIGEQTRKEGTTYCRCWPSPVFRFRVQI